ncbi:MAG: alcohol dehydrogenase catalytic domain-containing protein [Ignavibacteriaceae bacterium]
MKKASLTGIKKLELIETPKPDILKRDDVLLQIDTVGVCGSDMHYYNEGKIGDQIIDFPFAVGHECSAKIVEIGDLVSKVKVGDIVAVEPAVSCHQCPQCLSGREHTCLSLNFLGCPGQIEGCLSEFIVMPEHNCYPVPGNMNSEEAALVEPLSIGYYAVQFLKNIKFKKSAAILGSGPIGLSVMLFLKNMGIENILSTDKLDYRIEAAKSAGAKWTGNFNKDDITKMVKEINPELFDIVFECCGKQEALDQAVDILKPGGTLLIVGIPEKDRISFDISKIRRKEITIQNVRRQNNCVQPVIDLISSGKLDPYFMVTHRFPFEKANDAFKMVAGYEDNVIKALIKF